MTFHLVNLFLCTSQIWLLPIANGYPWPLAPSPRYISEFKSSEETVEIEMAPYVPMEFMKSEDEMVEKHRPMASLLFQHSRSRPSQIQITQESGSATTRSPIRVPGRIIFDDSSQSSSLEFYEKESTKFAAKVMRTSTSTTPKPRKWDKKNEIKTESSKWKKPDNHELEYTERFMAKGIEKIGCPSDSFYSKRQKLCIPKRTSSRNPSIG